MYFMIYRQILAIIPQDPFLFSGTIRENLDPYQCYTNEEIYIILEKCYLGDLVKNLGRMMKNVIGFFLSIYLIVRKWS